MNMDNLNFDSDLLRNVCSEQLINAFSDEAVTEIIINADGNLLVEHQTHDKQIIGKINPLDIQHFIHLVAQYRGLYLNQQSPDISVRLPDIEPFNGARMQAIVPPMTSAPSVTIRKHRREVINLSDFVEQKIVTPEQAIFLQEAIKNYRNIVVSGQPKSGKTTLMAALLAELPQVANPTDRIIVLEDVPELSIAMDDVEYLQTTETRTMTHLLKNAMRMRPDRIIVGEVVDGSALALLKAWNTGCPGGISTVHANGCEATLQRLVDLACENNIPPPINLMTTTIDVLVHIGRSPEYVNQRQVEEISLLKGYDYTTQRFVVEKIF